MRFSTFFSKQARKPSGLFGRFIMANIFNIGNAFLNKMVRDVLKVKNNDQVLDIGCGTGKLVKNLANQISDGYIEGVDFSNSMVSIALRKNNHSIRKGNVNITEGNFDDLSYPDESFSKVCCVNTIYFWPKPEVTAQKIKSILKPGGILVIAFEDIQQLEQKNLNNDVFILYTTEDVKNLLSRSGFAKGIEVITKNKGKSRFHCVVAKK